MRPNNSSLHDADPPRETRLGWLLLGAGVLLLGLVASSVIWPLVVHATP